MVDAVPVIDFSPYSLDRERPDPERFQQLVDEVHTALTTIGFMYLKNIGIPAQKIKDAFRFSKQFFSLPVEEKERCVRPEKSNHGYVQMEREGLNPERPFRDLKELFNYSSCSDHQPFPDESVPEFRQAMLELFSATKPLHQRILEVMARGLKLEDPMYFVDRHKLMGTKNSSATLRTLFYPSLENVDVKEDQVRCGEHSDYGAITLLFQDAQAGLEKHRVMLPVDQIRRRQERQSIAFFGHPDHGVIIECIDHSNKYPPIESVEYLNMRFDATYTTTASLQK